MIIALGVACRDQKRSKAEPKIQPTVGIAYDRTRKSLSVNLWAAVACRDLIHLICDRYELRPPRSQTFGTGSSLSRVRADGLMHARASLTTWQCQVVVRVSVASGDHVCQASLATKLIRFQSRSSHANAVLKGFLLSKVHLGHEVVHEAVNGHDIPRIRLFGSFSSQSSFTCGHSPDLLMAFPPLPPRISHQYCVHPLCILNGALLGNLP
jgi:hypothetical protein